MTDSKETYTIMGQEILTKEKAVEALCHTANSNCLPIHELWCYDDLCKQFGITDADYFNDHESLTQEYKDNAGYNNWMPISAKNVQPVKQPVRKRKVANFGERIKHNGFILITGMADRTDFDNKEVGVFHPLYDGTFLKGFDTVEEAKLYATTEKFEEATAGLLTD